MDLDVGVGGPVETAFAGLGVDTVGCTDPATITEAAALVLTGTGEFGAAMERLQETGFIGPLLERVGGGAPVLGVGLGMHLLFEGSEEDPGMCGLSLVRGDVRALPSTVKRHSGHSPVVSCTCSDLLADIPADSSFYFDHSYAVVPRSPAVVLTVTDHNGVFFVSSIETDNIAAVQFLVQESGAPGLQFCRNFARRAGLEGPS